MCRMRVEFALTSLTKLLNCVTRSRRHNGMNNRPRKLKATDTTFYVGKLLKLLPSCFVEVTRGSGKEGIHSKSEIHDLETSALRNQVAKL